MFTMNIQSQEKKQKKTRTGFYFASDGMIEMFFVIQVYIFSYRTVV